MFRSFWTVLNHLVRIGVVLGITSLVALVATWVRDDAVGIATGIGFGLFFGIGFVYVNWAGLPHE
jgi:hypothetical protein